MPYVYGRQPVKQSKKPLKIGVVFLIILIVIIGIWFIFDKKSDKKSLEVNAKTVKADPDIKSVDAKYLFSGTVVPARAVENEARKSDGTIDYDQPFSKLNTFNPSQYDGWVVDHECPVTDANIPYRQQVENTVFNCRPEFLNAMSKYFTVVNFANNHVYDQGKDKFPQMQQYAIDSGMQFLGNQDPSASKDVCEVMAMKVKVNKKDGSSKDGTLPIAFCAWHYFEREPYDGEFEVMNEYAKIMPVVGLMQVGVEYVPSADERQKSVSRSIIDGGAEFVIGNSPHWVQNTDVYNDKLIVYSTGNFIFDQLDEETNRGASIEANMTVPYDDNLAKWLELGVSCKVHYDDCLQKAQDAKLVKISPKFTFGLVASTTGYKEITQKADSATQKAVEDRANWLTTLKELGQQ